MVFRIGPRLWIHSVGSLVIDKHEVVVTLSVFGEDDWFRGQSLARNLVEIDSVIEIDESVERGHGEDDAI